MSELSPVEWAVRPLKCYAQFSGRASRAEYWWFILAFTLIGLALEYVDEALGGPVVGAYGPLSLIFEILLLVPGLAVQVRRLHDIDRSGWWVLLGAGSYGLLISTLLVPDPTQLLESIQNSSVGILLALVVAFIISAVVMLVFMITRGDDGRNRFGDDPYGPGRLDEIFA